MYSRASYTSIAYELLCRYSGEAPSSPTFRRHKYTVPCKEMIGLPIGATIVDMRFFGFLQALFSC